MLTFIRSPNGGSSRKRSDLLFSLRSTLIPVHSVGGFSGCKLVVWDTQTGVIVKQLGYRDSGWIGNDKHRRMFTFAEMAHSLLKDDTLNTKSLSKIRQAPKDWEPGPHWFHEESLYFTTTLETCDKLEISIREFRPTPTPSYPVVESFRVPYHEGQLSFSPVSFHASFLTNTEVIILDVRNSNTLLHTEVSPQPYYPTGLFSPDGCFFVCEMQGQDISVWKNTPAGYIPWSTIRPRLPWEGFSLSPTATSILTWGPGGIQLLRPDNCISPLVPYIKEPDLQDDNHLVASSTGATCIATSRQWCCSVTILDPLSGTLLHSIDTGSEVQDIKFVDNTLLVLSGHRLARWSLGASGPRGVEVDSEDLPDLGPVKHLTLSNDGAQIACVGNKLHMYDVKSRRVISSCRVPRIYAGVEGVRFSPSGSKLWFWSVSYDDRPGHPFDANGHIMQAEIKRGRFASSIEHDVEDGWSLFAFLQSRDGLRIGAGGKWVEDSEGRKLFWLPPNWRVKDVDDVRWEGNYLALVDGRHEMPIIIQFRP